MDGDNLKQGLFSRSKQKVVRKLRKFAIKMVYLQLSGISINMTRKAIIILYSVSMILLLAASLIDGEKRGLSLLAILLMVSGTIGTKRLLENKCKK